MIAKLFDKIARNSKRMEQLINQNFSSLKEEKKRQLKALILGASGAIGRVPSAPTPQGARRAFSPGPRSPSLLPNPGHLRNL